MSSSLGDHFRIIQSKLTFCAKQCGGALQEFSDLLQRSLFSAADAALGILAAG